MAQDVAVTPEYDPQLRDYDTDVKCVVEKVVDITEDCRAGDVRRVLLLFTRDSTGRIVQITQPYENELYMGVHVHFHIDGLDMWMDLPPRDDSFGSWATRLGLTKQELRELIEEHAPA